MSKNALELIAQAKRTRATFLQLEFTDLKDLSLVNDLTDLQMLSFGHTDVHDLSPLKDMINLRDLRAFNTQIRDLSPLKNLSNLQMLQLYITPVHDLSPLKNLNNLQELWINDTQVTDLSPLRNLRNLRGMDFRRLKIHDLSPLENLINIDYLSLDDTPISDLSPLRNLRNVTRWIELNNTQVSDLSPLRNLIEKGIQVTLKYFVHGIQVRECPLNNPPLEIVNQGNVAILRYWKEKERGGSKKINEARLLIVGQGGAGKTTFKEKLKNINAEMPKPDDTTRGIDIEPILTKNTEGGNFIVNVWDFGGQTIQHHAHQFFMSASVVYVVLSNTREQNANFHYWLNIIELLGGESPFFIIQNEKDGHTEALKDSVKIQERFPDTFQGVEQVNLKEAATDRRFSALKDKLWDKATQLPHTETEVLNSFYNIRQKLEALAAAGHATIPFKEFRQLCSDEGIEDKELMNDYARLMTELGIALHFADDVFLKNQVFLNPKWLIDALFQLLYHPSVERQHGHFTTADADAIWSEGDYEGMHGILIQVMEKFRLCFRTSGAHYIVPQRLPVRTEAFVAAADATTHLIYQYKFLPSGFLTQLTCELHARIEGDKVWSDAVQLVTPDGQGRVFIRETNDQHKIELFGWGSLKADLLNRAVEVMDEIHSQSKFKNLVVTKLVPCPCGVCEKKPQNERYFFKYQLLIDLLQDGEDRDRCDVSRKMIFIPEILKHANIKAVKLSKIHDLIAQYKPQEAVNLLRGLFPTEWAQMAGRLSGLEQMDRFGMIDRDERNASYQKWASDFLKIAKDLLK